MIRKGLLPDTWFEAKKQYFSFVEKLGALNLTIDSLVNMTKTGDYSNSMIDNNTAIQMVTLNRTIDAINAASTDDDRIEILWSVTVAIFVLFGMIGAFASGKFADYFGRYNRKIMKRKFNPLTVTFRV